ncbi:hypothetical protein AeNC1_017455, partial [Aphanomyces euteiches]
MAPLTQPKPPALSAHTEFLRRKLPDWFEEFTATRVLELLQSLPCFRLLALEAAVAAGNTSLAEALIGRTNKTNPLLDIAAANGHLL